MCDRWLNRGEVPNKFDNEQSFSKQLAEQLDGLKFKSCSYDPTDAAEKYTIEAEHSTGNKYRPDIAIHHDMPTGGGAELSNPFFIECKSGDAYKSGDEELTSFTDTGIKQMQIEFSQLFRYHYDEESVSFSDNIRKGDPNKYEYAMPEGKHRVLFTCPFLLTRPSNLRQDQCECCGYNSVQHLIDIREQFSKTMWDLGFGVFYRKRNGKLVFRTSYHGNHKLLVSHTK